RPTKTRWKPELRRFAPAKDNARRPPSSGSPGKRKQRQWLDFPSFRRATPLYLITLCLLRKKVEAAGKLRHPGPAESSRVHGKGHSGRPGHLPEPSSVLRGIAEQSDDLRDIEAHGP